MANISIYGSHNSAIALEIDEKIIVLEAERFSGYKNAALAQYKIAHNSEILLMEMLLWIRNKFNVSRFDTCYYCNTDVNHDNILYRIEQQIPADNYVDMKHHLSHANGTFYQSSFEDALIFSFDGGGNDGKFNVYLANRSEGAVLLEKVLNPIMNDNFCCYDLGFPYMVIGHYLKDIKQEPLGDGNLVYPGKIMGLVSYGTVNEDWLPHFIQFYKNDPNGNNYRINIQELGDKINVTFDERNRLEGQIAYDIAATSQKAFEECFLEVAIPYMKKYENLPVCITGGCGLNIILNTRLVSEFGKEVFVGPTPNDCGIAVGMILTALKPKRQYDMTYGGIPLMDRDNLGMYLNDLPNVRLLRAPNHPIALPGHVTTSSDTIITDLINGKIIGLVVGQSEHGPRALGNRSILCNPSVVDMKNTLNSKVKNREWYRPFAPVVRLQDVNKYFDWNTESRWMSFCPTVKEEWREKLAAITHVDNTARVQTVTQAQHPWLYYLLTRMEALTGVGVLLNTSFNINGKPILSTIHDAIKLYSESHMDGLIIDGCYYIRKEGFTDEQ